ncbi:tetratricopeptide repeat protein [Spiribacter halobius]|nr:tetratricopeptide repeat protein [Spiribacter halobius]UEX76729.1 tetratricopeptide repeat protein [Spiribacter halobius]
MIKHPPGGFSRGLAVIGLTLLLAGCAALKTPPPEDAATAGEVRAEADAAYAAEDWERAAARYRGYLALEGTDAEAWYRLGNAEARRGELEEAEAALRRSLELAPERAEARHNLGLVQLQLGRRNLLAARRELPAADATATQTVRYLACLMALFRGRPDC